MKKKVSRPGFEDYERVPMVDTVTFGTILFMRNDRRALKIVFPTGQVVTFAPMDEIENGKQLTNERNGKQKGDRETIYKVCHP
jgi:hypothetical protein